ncbi:MAG: acyl-CoA dehydrogenase family protein, partial [Jatrophihabitantaceae bacterium]
KAMAQSGLLSLALPERLGGDGFGVVEIAVVLTEVGRQTLPVPALATLALGVLPIRALGTSAQQEILTEVGSGRILTGSLLPIASRADGDDVLLDGSVAGVLYAEQAYRVLVPVDSGIVMVDPTADGVTLVRTPASTGAPEYTLCCKHVRVNCADVLRGDPETLTRYGTAGAIAVADGVMAAALALTAEHLRTREQFGKPLATFQAVAQQIADVYVIARTVNLIAQSVSWRLSSGRDADDDLNVAGYWLAAEVPTALQVCHHLHGGLGVDITYPLHRYYSEAKDLARLVGGASARLTRIGA